jgi:hypothetical protein
MWPVYVPPLPPPPDRSQQVDRHVGMWCGCALLDCCHHEWPEYGTTFRTCSSGRHVDSGSPQSGYLYPWAPGDESWRDTDLGPVSRA